MTYNFLESSRQLLAESSFKNRIFSFGKSPRMAGKESAGRKLKSLQNQIFLLPKSLLNQNFFPYEKVNPPRWFFARKVRAKS
jgi:hypothetical protein